MTSLVLRFALSVVNLAIEKIYPAFGSGVCVCVDLLKRSKTCTWISIFGSLWDLYLDGILTNLTYMKFKLQILYWFIARLRGLPLWYFIHEVQASNSILVYSTTSWFTFVVFYIWVACLLFQPT